jgi:tyrosyl-tRNA synthetase
MTMTVDERVAYLAKGCVDIVRANELRAKIERGQPLTVKVGFDPTAPDLHLGHTVVIRKMKHFQDLGHRVVFVIGDFTAMIGDPTGRSKTRPALSPADIAANSETYKTQVFRILDPAKTEIELNSRWLSPLGADGLVRLAARYNVAQMLERRDFKQRFEARKPIAIHEFLYPLAQAYDSVFLKADVELGGTDQLFNLNVGRDIMPGYGLEPQVVMTTPLLEGVDGVEKMSKSLGNYIGVTDLPDDMFGKVMSISDGLMWRYALLLTDDSPQAVDDRRQRVASGALHPKRAKSDLAERIVSDFHSPEAARRAAERFEARFSRGEIVAGSVEEHAVEMPEGGLALARMLVSAGLATSASDAARKIQQGGVRFNRERVADPRLRVGPGDLPAVVEVGRRAVRLVAAGTVSPGA